MRIISGKYKGKKINPGKHFKARPTTDFAKEALFNILSNNFDFSKIMVLDLFAGTGGISYEFASRGSYKIDTIEFNRSHVLFIKNTVKLLEASQISVIQIDAVKFIKNCTRKYELIFADPPYDFKNIEIIPDLIFENELLEKDGWLILEHSGSVLFTGNKNLIDHKKYGSVNFSFFAYTSG